MIKLYSEPDQYVRMTMILMVTVFLVFPSLSASSDKKETTPETKTPIHITSDQLVMNNQTREAEFIGNVKATQDATVIHSDSLKIFYKKDTSPNAALAKGEQSIQKIIATGKVKINFDNRLAQADRAVYDADSRMLTLTGKNCTIEGEGNTISGEKIVFYREDGRVFVESGQEKKRVEAIISTNGKGLK